jgi:hypothetical protein
MNVQRQLVVPPQLELSHTHAPTRHPMGGMGAMPQLKDD